jgi:CheY-like chemotaxis protein
MTMADLIRMLALEAVYDVTVVKDGQEAYDTVKANMEEGKVFDLIFMDIQVRPFPHYSIALNLLTPCRCLSLTASRVPDSSARWDTRHLSSR